MKLSNITLKGMHYADRQANRPLIRYYVRHSNGKRLQWLLKIVSEEIARREK